MTPQSRGFTMSEIYEISNSQYRPIRSTLTLGSREEHPHMASPKASTSKPKPIIQDALINKMHQKTNAGIKRSLHVWLICMLSLWHNGIDMPLSPRSPGCRRCLYSTLRLKPVSLTHTTVWRNELYPLLSYN